MKKWLCMIAAAVLLTACGAKESIVGVWRCETFGSELVLEFAADGTFTDVTDGVSNRYRIEGKNVVTYVEDEEDSEVTIPYTVKKDVLTLGGVAYTRVNEQG